jgi:Glycerophosphoryl diester phosphodiesterase family
MKRIACDNAERKTQMSRIDNGKTATSHSLSFAFTARAVMPQPGQTKPAGLTPPPRGGNGQRAVDAKTGKPVDFGGKGGVREAPNLSDIDRAAPAPPAPQIEGVDVGYGIDEDATRDADVVEYYDAKTQTWVKIGGKGDGKGADITSDTGTSEGETVFIPDQDGKPPLIRLRNESKGTMSIGYGTRDAKGNVVYRWKDFPIEDAAKIKNLIISGGFNSFFDSSGYASPHASDLESSGDTHRVGWADGGATKAFDHPRHNVMFYYKGATGSSPAYSPGKSKISQDTAYRTLCAINGNVPLTAADMAGYVKDGIVVSNPDGTWSLDPSKMSTKDLKTIVINIISDKALTPAQKDALLDSIGVTEPVRAAIDSKVGDNDGTFEVKDITEASIKGSDGKTTPFDLQFKVKLANGAFIALSDASGFAIGFADDKPIADTIGEKAFAKADLDPATAASGVDVVAGLKTLGYSFDPKGSGVDAKLAPYVLEGLAHGNLTAATLDTLIKRGVIKIDPKTKKITIDKSKMTDADVAFIAAAILVADIPPAEKSALLAKLGISAADQKKLDAAVGDGNGRLDATDFEDEGMESADSGPTSSASGGAPKTPGLHQTRGRKIGLAVVATGMASLGLIYLDKRNVSSLALIDPNLTNPRADINYASGSTGGTGSIDPGEADLIVDAYLGRNAKASDLPQLIKDGVLKKVKMADGTTGYQLVPGKFSEKQLNGIIANILDNKDGNNRSADKDLAMLGLSPRDIAVLKTIHFKVGEKVTGAGLRAKGTKDMFDLGGDGKVSVSMGPDFARDRRSKDAIPQSESTWQQAQPPELPPGTSESDVYPQYTQPDIFGNWKPGDREIVPHRGKFDNGRGVPENSLGSIDAAVGVDPVTGVHDYNTVEIDVVSTKDGKIVLSHDLGSDRSTTRGPKPIKEMNADEIVGQPIVVREVKDGKFTGKYVVTNEPVVTMETAIDYALQTNPNAVIIIDARTSDPELVAAEIAKLPPEKQKHVAIQTYPYNYADGQAFVDKVNEAGAPPGWEKNVQIIPVLPSPLTKDLARKKYHLPPNVEPTYAQRVAAGEEWLDSFDKAGVNVVADSIQIEGTGEFYDPATDTVSGDFTPEELKDPKIKSDFRGDAANIEIYKRHRDKHPDRPVVNSYRSDDYKSNGSYYIYGFADGKPSKKPTGAAGQGSENRATPGTLTDYGDIVITDRPDEEKAALVDERDGVTDLTHSRDFPGNNIADNPA